MSGLGAKANKKRVTADWQAAVAEMSEPRPLHLVKVGGPTVLGVYLEPSRGGDVYTPIGHLHCLGVEWPIVSLSCKVAARTLTLRQHGPEIVAARWQELRSLAPILGMSSVPLASIFETYWRTIQGGLFPVITAYLPIYGAAIATASYYGRKEVAAAILEDVRAQSGALRGELRDDAEKWLTGAPSLLDEVRVRAVARSELEKHGLVGARSFEVLDTEVNWTSARRFSVVDIG